MIKGLGCDMAEIARMEEKLKTEGFAEKVFTERERSSIAQKGAQTAAGCWAAKEAVAKALGTGFTGFGPADIEILTDVDGAPHAFLYRGAQMRMARLGALSVFVSISHEKGMAMAVAVVE